MLYVTYIQVQMLKTYHDGVVVNAIETHFVEKKVGYISW